MSLYKKGKLSLLYAGQTGIAMVEALVATVIIGLVAVVFMGGLSTISKTNYIIYERSEAERLASSQMELIKSNAYINYADPLHGSYDVVTTPGDYSISVTVTPVDPATGLPLGSGLDNGVQKVIVAVSFSDKTLMTASSYKVDR